MTLRSKHSMKIVGIAAKQNLVLEFPYYCDYFHETL